MTITYYRCAKCGYDGHFRFYNPDSIYCEGCDMKVGETTVPVEDEMAVLSGENIVRADTGEVLSEVEWYNDPT